MTAAVNVFMDISYLVLSILFFNLNNLYCTFYGRINKDSSSD